MRKPFTHWLATLLVALPFIAFAQPANNDCGGAIPATFINPQGTGCTTPTVLPFTTDGTTDSGVPTVCSNPGNDQYFTWTATTLALKFFSDSPGDPGVAIFASCADALAGTEIDCANTFADATLSGWAIGDNLIIQIYDFNGSSSDVGFCLEEFTPPPPPANDDCVNATPVTLGAASCGPTVVATNESATGVAGNVCGSTSTAYGDGDIWFSFTPSGSSVFLDLITGVGSLYISVYDACGGTCVYDNNFISTSTDEQISGLTAGQTYYIRMYESGNNAAGTIEFCMFNAPPPPPNDECANATPVPVGSGACNRTTVATNFSATGTAGNVCGSTSTAYGDGDIWFSFTPSGTDVFLDLITGVGSLYISVYDACGGACVYDNNLLSTSSDELIPGLTPGQTYYIRMYESGNNAFGNIEFCMYEVTAVPANDLCANAQPVTVGNLTCGPTVSGTNINATDSGEGPVCGSGTYSGGDLFYTFVAGGPTAEIDLISTVGSLYGEVYSGSCGALTAVYCSNFLSTSSNEVITGLTAGQTYVLRLFESGNDAFGTFEFCMFTPPPPPINDVCAGAIAANVGANGTCPGGAGAYSEDFTRVNDSGTYASCDLSGNYDLWYTWTATAGSIDFTSGTAAPGFAVWEGACTSLVEIGCLNNVSGSIGGLTIGQTYLLQVWDDSQGASLVEWCFQEGPACANPTGLTVSNRTQTTADVSFNPIGSGSNTVEFGPVGFAPGTGTTVAVPTGNSVTITGLMPSTTYDVYVSADCNGVSVGPETFTTFGPPPANDECTNAITIPVTPFGGTCTPSVADNTNATNSTPAFGVDPTCNSYAGGDLWYAFTATATSVTVEVSVNNFSTFAAAVYDAGCTSTVEVDCGGTFGTGNFTLDGLIAGQQYVMRVYDFGNDNFGPSEFCLVAPAPPAPNDDCTAALALFDANGQPTGANGASYNTSSATDSNVPGSCEGGTEDDDVWFAVDAQPGSTLTITVDGGSDFDAVLGVLTGACTGAGQVACVDDTGTGGTETYTFTTSLTGGGSGPSSPPTTYLIQVYDFFTGGGSFTITASLQAPLPVELTRLTAEAAGSRNVVRWAAASEVAFSHYVLERAVRDDLADFATVTEVAARGAASGAEAVYEAYDAAPAAVTYYRLRAVDRDGSAEYSDVVAVRRTDVAGGGVKVWPNPAAAGGAVSIGLPAGLEEADVFVHDAAGRQVARLRATSTQVDLPLGGLPAGVYAVTARGATASQTVRLVIE